MLKIATFPIFHGWADYRQTRSTVADVTLYMTDPANFLVCPDGASWFQRFPRNVSSDKASWNSKRERNISEFLSFFFFQPIEILFLSNSIPWNRWALFKRSDCKYFLPWQIFKRGQYTLHARAVCSSNRFELYADSYSSIL